MPNAPRILMGNGSIKSRFVIYRSGICDGHRASPVCEGADGSPPSEIRGNFDFRGGADSVGHRQLNLSVTHQARLQERRLGDGQELFSSDVGVRLHDTGGPFYADGLRVGRVT